MKRRAFIFDVDGTIVDSRALTEACYIQALNEAEERGELPVGSFPELPIWGRTAEEWGCPPAVHLRKTELFAEKADTLLPGWAHPMMCEAILRGHHVVILTGASQTTMDILLRTPVLRRLAPSVVPIHAGMTDNDKELIVSGIASEFDVVHYFDDLSPEWLGFARNNLYAHHPPKTQRSVAVVVLAAGRGERFRVVGETVPKPLLQVGGRQLLEYALGSAREVSAEPIVVATEQIIATMACDAANAVPVRVTQRGPVASAELAGGLISEDTPVLFMDSDVILSPGIIHKFVADSLTNLASSAVLVSNRDGRTGKYGGYRMSPLLTGPGIFVEANDKCELCFVGAYLFKAWAEFKRLAAVARVEEDGEEFKFTSLFRLAEAVQPVRMPSADWTPLGTPEEFYRAL